jgi:hypothetical protein
METLKDLPRRSEIELVLTADDPASSLKAGDRIKAIWMGRLWRRPTTVRERSIRRRILHEPIDGTTCTCGNAYAEAAAFGRHIQLSTPAWSRVRFRYWGRRGERVARPIGGHEMHFPVEDWTGAESIVCSCGWSYAARGLRRAGPIAREHVRSVLRSRVGTASCVGVV